MNARRMARVLSHLLALVVLVVSGAYLLIYLYRWEWNRALVAGVFFVATEIVLAASTILARLRELERRLDDDRSRGLPAAAVTRGGDTSRFPWLESSDRLGVFIPVLLGVGVILSALAYLVERLASWTAPPTGSQDTARVRARLGSVGGALTGATPGSLRPDAWDLRDPGASMVRVGSLASAAVVLLVTALLVTAAVNVLADATMNRPDPELDGRVSRIDLDVDQKGKREPAAAVAEALWVSCRGTLPGEEGTATITPLGPDRARITLDVALGTNGERRFTGCLQDGTLDLVRAEVVAFENVPA